jgi:hypothetical protein
MEASEDEIPFFVSRLDGCLVVSPTKKERQSRDPARRTLFVETSVP